MLLDSLRYSNLLRHALRSVMCFVFGALLNELDIEVLHTNSLKAFVLGGIAGRLQGVKVICTYAIESRTTTFLIGWCG